MVDFVERVIDTASALLISTGRSIGGIEPDVTIEEVSRDTTFITNHPVERGAAISDHAFMMPFEVEMRVAWSDSTGGFQGYARLIYEALQALQQAREPFDVVIGKRLYQNMLIASLEQTTSQDSEYALFARVGLREVIIVNTETTSLPNAKTPASTSGTTATGTKQTVETPAVPLPYATGQ